MTGWRTRAGLALLVALLAHACLALGWWLGAFRPPHAELQLPSGAGNGLEVGLAPAPPKDPAAAAEKIVEPSANAITLTAAVPGRPRKAETSGAGGGGNSTSYFTRVRMHLNRFREAGGPVPSGSGVTDVRFEVAADGSVRNLEVIGSGGARQRDAAALALLRRAAPLPPPPDGQATRLVVPIEFR